MRSFNVMLTSVLLIWAATRIVAMDLADTGCLPCSCEGKLMTCNRRNLTFMPQQNPNVTSLLIIGTQFGNTDKYDLLTNMGTKNLETLTLRNCVFGKDFMLTLDNLTNLATINFENTRIADTQVLFTLMSFNVQVETLSISGLTPDNYGLDIGAFLFSEELGVGIEHLSVSNSSLTTYNMNTIPTGPIEGYNDTGISAVSRLNLTFNKLDYLPDYAFTRVASLEILDLGHNKISNVTENTFAHRNLQRLYFGFNGYNFSSCCSNIFGQLPVLRELDISGNDLSQADGLLLKGLFSTNLTQLQALLIQSCGLRYIVEGMFKNLPNLGLLDLSYNSISDWPRDTFTNMRTLQFLYIASNNIRFLHKTSFSTNICVDISSNPFACTCDLFWFLRTFPEGRLMGFPVDYTCYTPTKMTGQPLTVVEQEMSFCNKNSHTNTAVAIGAGVVGGLIIVAVVIYGIVFVFRGPLARIFQQRGIQMPYYRMEASASQ